jgi:hypothetical protein
MRIDYEGQSYEFDMDDITVKQAIKIEKHLGCPFAEFGERLSAEEGKIPDLMAVQCLGWLILHGGRDVPIEDTDFKVTALSQALGDAMEKATAAEEAAAGPTVAAGLSGDGAAVMAGPLTVP